MGMTLMILSDAEKYKWMTDIKAIMTSTMNADKSKLVPDSSPSISFTFCFENAHSSSTGSQANVFVDCRFRGVKKEKTSLVPLGR